MLCIQCFLLSQNGDNVCGGRGVAVQADEGVVVLNTLTVFVVMCVGDVVGGDIDDDRYRGRDPLLQVSARCRSAL